MQGSLDVAECVLQNNGLHGIVATDSAEVYLRNCRSSGHGVASYCARRHARMTVRNSSSDGDTKACMVQGGGELVMEGLTVDGVVRSGECGDPFCSDPTSCSSGEF